MTAARLRNTGRFSTPGNYRSSETQVRTLNGLLKAMDPASRTATPIRPQGAGTACTSCNDTQTGTVLRIGGLDDIVNIDTFNNTISAQAGVRLHRLVEALAEEGLELLGAHDLTGRTLGGAIAAPSMGPGIGQRSSCLASRVVMQLRRLISLEDRHGLGQADEREFGTEEPDECDPFELWITRRDR